MRWIALALCLLLPGLAAAQSAKPDPKQAELDKMLDALRVAPNEAAAGALEQKIEKRWFQAGGSVAALLMSRGTRDLNNNADDEAVDDFDAALTLEPGLAEAYHRRALARAALGDYAGAVIDLQAALQREPRNFAALQSLSRIAEQHDDFNGALAAWRKVLDLSPKTPDGEERLKTLQRKALGSET